MLATSIDIFFSTRKIIDTRYYKQLITLAIGIFSLTESTNDKSISATAMPVDERSETEI